MIGDDTQVLGVEIGKGEVQNFVFLLEIGEMLERIEVGVVAVVPPVTLQ